MKFITLTTLFGLISFLGYTQTNSNARFQQGYVKKTGTYIRPHFKTKTNKTNHDNYSTSPNVNAYTGRKGSKAKDHSAGAYSYGRGRIIHTGARGGQYYYNSRGRKTYVPKR